MNTISRAQFLRGDWRGRALDLRPPWAIHESEFIVACDGCGDCIRACPQGILASNRGFPTVSFSSGECTFCGDCVRACPTGALTRPGAVTVAEDVSSDHGAWSYRATISDRCLARQGTSCVACVDDCGQRAIVTAPALAGRLNVRVDSGPCNGCGSCIGVCPVAAIEIQ